MATTDTQAAPSNLGKKVKRYFILFLLVLVLMGIGLWSYTTFTCFSEGNKVGTVTKFSKKGVIFKTWEGELLINPMQQTKEQWVFSTQDPKVAEAIDKAQQSNHTVVLKYCQKFYKFPWQGDTEYFIEAVEETK